MATRAETAQALTSARDGWIYRPRSADAPLRRPLFQAGDVFLFSQGDCDCRLTLRVVGAGNLLVLGADLTLEWSGRASAYVTTAYGRHMEFSAAQAMLGIEDDLIRMIRAGTAAASMTGVRRGWALVYRCEYQSPPHNSPDEGGDGDPK